MVLNYLGLALLLSRHVLHSAILQSKRLVSLQVDQQEMARGVLCYFHGYSRQPLGCGDVTKCRLFRAGTSSPVNLFFCTKFTLSLRSLTTVSSLHRWWSWISCTPAKEFTGDGTVDIASLQQLQHGTRLRLF